MRLCPPSPPAPLQLVSSPSLEGMFAGYSLRSMCTLLRFLYWPDEATSSSFSQLEASTTLPEVVRLAHMLDAPSLLGKLERYLSATRECCLTACYRLSSETEDSELRSVGWAMSQDMLAHCQSS